MRTLPAAAAAAALLLASACSGSPGPVAKSATGPGLQGRAAWVTDLAELAEQVRAIHPDPFWRMSETDFDAALAAAPDLLVDLDRPTATAEIMRLTAGIDGHSGVSPAEAGFHLYDLHLYSFDDGVHVVGGGDPALVGDRLDSIGGIPADEAWERVRPYSAFDNDTTLRVTVPMLLMTPEVLVAAGVVSDPADPRFVLVDPAGERRTFAPEQLDWDTFLARHGTIPVGLPEQDAPLALSRRADAFWWTTLDGARGPVLYLLDNHVVSDDGTHSVGDVARAVRTALDRGATRVVLDLRNNNGGDNRTFAPLVHALRDDPRVNAPGRLAVIIGRQTFSAAVNLATVLDLETAAIFVGEPTGGRPDVYADVRPVRLPNSGITVEVSSRYWEFDAAGADRPAIEPDVRVQLQVKDLLDGTDPVLDAALGAGVGVR